MTHRVAFVIFPGFHLLDASGPISAFDLVRRFVPQAYDIQVMAPGGGSVASTSGIAFEARPLETGPFDTIMVAGGDMEENSATSAQIVAWLKREAPCARRTSSVSTGAFLLAEGDLLNGRRVTTHWGVTHLFSKRFPEVSLDADRIYIHDGPVWTSGGATAGIDLALALIEEDFGSDIARRIAQLLVVHQRRPGGQSQHSALLELGGATGRLAQLMAWVRDHLAEALSVEAMASQAAMSPRHFARMFTQEIGLTPAKAVEKMRVDKARAMIDGGHLAVEDVARQCGFGEADRMRRAFLRHFGLPPQVFRQSARLS